MTPSEPTVRAAVLRFAAARTGVTFCPSEVARDLAPEDWRPLMPTIREVAQQLVDSGELRCTQHGVDVSALEAHGPIRLSAPKNESAK